jgi:hypothetical protein
MSDEMERRLREAGHRLPAPDDQETAAARARFVEAAPTPRRPKRRVLAVAVALVALAGAFGVGYAIAGAGAETKVVRMPARLDAGPGFAPAAGWDVEATGVTDPSQAMTATTANVPLDGSALGPNGVRLVATFTRTRGGLPQSLLPLRLEDATGTGETRRLRARVAAYDVDVTIFFGAAQPSAGVLAAAREALGRLVVPACPDAQPLEAGDADSATRYLLSWLPAHYPGDASEVVGARATAAVGAEAPRHGEAAHDCGVAVAQRTVEVDVVLPKLERISASLSQLTYFVAKTPDGWTVWERVH